MCWTTSGRPRGPCHRPHHRAANRRRRCAARQPAFPRERSGPDDPGRIPPTPRAPGAPQLTLAAQKVGPDPQLRRIQDDRSLIAVAPCRPWPKSTAIMRCAPGGASQRAWRGELMGQDTSCSGVTRRVLSGRSGGRVSTAQLDHHACGHASDADQARGHSQPVNDQQPGDRPPARQAAPDVTSARCRRHQALERVQNGGR
jgi:hypothetical protein